LKTIEILLRPGTYERLEELGLALEEGLARALRDAGVPGCIQRMGSMQTLFFRAAPVRDYAGAKGADTARYARFYGGMRARGISLPPSQYECWFLSLAHTETEIAEIVSGAGEALKECQ
jgi:glutamate-1-semialdehyde 2,1-aminomutase